MHKNTKTKGPDVPTKRTDNKQGQNRSRTSRSSASRGARTGSYGYTNQGKGSPRTKPSTRGTSSRPSSQENGRPRRTVSAQETNASVGQIIGGLANSAAQGIAGAVGSVFHKNEKGGFSTSFHGTQKGNVPSFSSQHAQGSNPGSVNIEGGMPASGPEVLLTRRNVVIGGAALGGLVLAGGGVSMAIDHFDGTTDTVNYISVSSDAVTGIDDLKQVKEKTYVTTTSTHHLPFGTLAFADNDSYACLLVPSDTSTPLNTIQSMTLSSGSTHKLVSKARGAKDGFDIVDARLSKKGLVWVESNAYESSWRIYTATFNGSSVSSVTKVDEGDANWLIPSIAATDSKAFWQICPNTEGDEAASPSVVRFASFSSKDHSDLISSKRAFATRLTCADEGVVCTPRAESTGTYYQLTLLDKATGEVVDSMTLPSNMSPDQAAYGRTGFSFGFTDTYNYGDGIANLGTYTPMKKTAPYQYDNLDSWLRYGRTPSADPCWCGEWFCVKSTRSIVGIHFSSKRYFSITPPSDTDDWGEYLVSSGTRTKIVGMSKITPSDGKDPYTLIRIFTTKTGKLGNAL